MNKLMAIIILAVIAFGAYKMLHKTTPRYEWVAATPEQLQQFDEIEKHRFDGSRVIIYSAWPYDGFSVDKAGEGWRLVALDIEFLDVRKGIDLTDLGIMDADTGKSLGDDPQISGIDADTGQILADQSKWPESLKRFRGYFIFEAENQTRNVKLDYCSYPLPFAAVPIAATSAGKPQFKLEQLNKYVSEEYGVVVKTTPEP